MAAPKAHILVCLPPAGVHRGPEYQDSVDMSDLTGQSMLNDICLGDCGNERRATLSAKTITCVGARTENWQRA